MKQKVQSKKATRHKASNVIPEHGDNDTSHNHKTKKVCHIIVDILLPTIASIATLITAIVALCTLREMRTERLTAFQPSIICNPMEYTVSWNSAGKSKWIDDYGYGLVENKEDIMSLHIHNPTKIYYEDVESFFCVNAGVGLAKNVYLTWNNSSNMERYKHYMICNDVCTQDFLQYDKSIILSYDYGNIILDNPTSNALMYMLPNAEEKYGFPFPNVYYLLIEEIIKNSTPSAEMPYLELVIQYDDLLGNNYSDLILLQPKIISVDTMEDGSGEAKFQLIPIHSIQ